MLRERRFETKTAETLSGGRSGPEPADREPGPEELAAVADMATRVREAVARLPAGQRSAVIAFYLAGLSYRETADALGIAVTAAKTRLHKARSVLRRELRSLWEEEIAMSNDELIRVQVADVRPGHDAQGPSPFVALLEEVDGDRRLPIWIGGQEASSLVLSLEAIALPRPLVYQFMHTALQATGARLVEVRIERLVEGTYYAVAVFEGSLGRVEIDARPSDALNVALLADAPVWVRRQAWEAGRHKHEETLARLDELFPCRGREIMRPDTPPEQAKPAP